ncbi:hypothetical protein ACFV9C_01775 [Kribbella sp. NPDC059898]|uniref:hypothetical protein n=1 Tax=Kribbella sp. NPDC059898 TaxID=3346995 RepID=UPI0036499195
MELGLRWGVLLGGLLVQAGVLLGGRLLLRLLRHVGFGRPVGLVLVGLLLSGDGLVGSPGLVCGGRVLGAVVVG